MNTYNFWNKRYIQGNLLDFSRTEEGLLWLKLRSIDRKDLLEAFGKTLRGNVGRLSVEIIWEMLNSDDVAKESLFEFMRECQKQENVKIDRSFELIRSNLYKMNQFHWGGGFRNSLDKAIVSRYVKTDSIIPFETLDKICEGELLEMSRGYLLNSWYNYWSSVLIENIFRRNPDVMPAYGKIKNVDFFVKDFPFDLKVTYIPKEYAKMVRKELGFEEPLKKMKRLAKILNITYDNTTDDELMLYELTERFLDAGTKQCKEILKAVKAEWNKTVNHIMSHKNELVRWLYENQGDMRFGAENRIFLVLVDMNNPNEAWKLKRNMDLIQPKVTDWVKAFDRKAVDSLLISFDYNQEHYKTYADIIFACK